MGELERIWESAKSLFFPKKVEETLKAELPKANLRNAIIIFAAAALLTSAFSVLSTIEAALFGTYAYNTMAEVVDIGQADFDIGPLVPFILFQFFFLAPFSLAYGIFFEGLTYKILKLIKGKADFRQHLYLSSLVTLSLAIASALSLLAPLPCLIQVVGALGLIILTLYFMTYVSAKAYEAAHRISLLPILAVVFVLLVPRLLLMLFILQWAPGIFGIPESYEISGV
jgi:hypothetical protein